MDRTTRCPKCGKRLTSVATISGRTDLQCISCDDPAVKWAESPLIVPEKPIVVERLDRSAHLGLMAIMKSPGVIPPPHNR